MIRRTLACALAIAGATAFVAAPPARAATALCASHGKRGFKTLSLPADQRKALLRSLTTETIRHGRITTTHTRAKEVQKHVDKMITLGKRGDLHARRQAHRLHLLVLDVPAQAEAHDELVEGDRLVVDILALTLLRG